MNDPVHAEAIAKWRAANPTEEVSKPGWQSWSPEVDYLTRLLDAVHVLTATVVQANGGKANKVEPTPRPHSEVEEATKKATYERKLKVHEMLKSKLLRNRPK